MPYLGNVPSSFNVGTNNIDNGAVTSAKLSSDLNIDLDLGSASTPSLTFDANTGIYSPGADQVAISTNGSGRLFINSSGQVGVGTSSPQQTFHVKTSSGFHDLESAGSVSLIRFYGTGAAAGQVAAGLSGSSFRIDTGGSTALTIDSSQRVGVGTTTPAALLHTVGGNVRIDGTGGTARPILEVQPGSAPSDGVDLIATYTGSGSYGPLKFWTGGSQKATIDSSGRVGIGTSSPSALLDVRGNIYSTGAVNDFGSGQYPIIRINSSINNAVFGFALDGNQNGAYNGRDWRIEQGRSATGAFNITDITAGNLVRLAINSSGNVGIGVTAPEQLLHIGGNNGIRFGNAGATPKADISYTASGDEFLDIKIQGTTTGYGNIRFSTGGTPSERARIDTSGRLLVGTSSSVTGGNAQYGRFQSIGNTYATPGNGIMVLGRSEAATSITDGEGLGAIYFTDNAAGEFARIDGVADGTAGTNDYPGRLTFSVTRDGQASPEERMRIGQGGNIRMFAGANSGGLALALTDNSASGQDGVTLAHSATGITGSGTVSFRVIANGNVTNTNNSYGAISDAKLKENIVDATSQWSDIKALQVRKYNFKEGQTHTQIGLVAQEVELVSPGLVNESPDRDSDGNALGTVTKSVNYSVLYMKAVKALQEAMERIEQLETEMAEVKAQLS